MQEIPIQPCRLVILVVGIVIPALGIHELITCAEHRRPIGQEKKAAEILDLLHPKRHHIIRYTFVTLPPTVPTVILVAPVLILTAVGPIMFVVVGNQIVEAESVVAGHEIDALIGMVGMQKLIGKEVIAAV